MYNNNEDMDMYVKKEDIVREDINIGGNEKNINIGGDDRMEGDDTIEGDEENINMERDDTIGGNEEDYELLNGGKGSKEEVDDDIKDEDIDDILEDNKDEEDDEEEDDDEEDNEDFEREYEDNEALPEIEILYIPDEVPTVNIYSDDVLAEYYNDFFNDDYKAKELVHVHKRVIDDKDNRYRMYYLKDADYKEPIYDYVYELDRIKQFDYEQYDRSKRQYMFPLVIKTTEDIVDGGYVIFDGREFYLDGKFSSNHSIFRYMCRSDETLWRKLGYVKERLYESDEEIELLDNDIEYIDNEMKRYGYSFYEMSEDMMKKIPKIVEKEYKTSYRSYKIKNKKESNLFKDSIGEIHIDLEPSEFERYGIIRNNLSSTKLLYYDNDTNHYNYKQLIDDVGNNAVPVEDVKKNISDYLKLLRVNHVLEILKDMRETQEKVDEIDRENILEGYLNFEKNVLDQYFVDINDAQEVVEGTDESEIFGNIYVLDDNMYDENISDMTKTYDQSKTSVYINREEDILKYSLKYKNDKDLYESINTLLTRHITILREVCGLPLDIELVLDRCVKTHDKDMLICFILVWYMDIQESIYNNTFDDLDTYYSSGCVSLMKKNQEPIRFENDNIKYEKFGVLPYMICCLEEIDENQKSIWNRIANVLKRNEILRDRLDSMRDLYNSNGNQKNNDEFVNMIKYLKNDMKDKNDMVHERFISALLYIPTVLNRINEYKMGCCKQLLNSNFTSFTDIPKDNKNALRYLRRYMEEYNRSVVSRWDVLKYPKYVEYEKMLEIMEDFENVEENQDDNSYAVDLYNVLSELETFPLEVFKRNKNSAEMVKYIEKTISNVLFYSETNSKNKIFHDFIMKGCFEIKNVKKLITCICHIDMENLILYRDVLDKLDMSCCIDKEYVERRSYSVRYIACMILNEDVFQNAETMNHVVNCVNNFDISVLTRDEYNKTISKIREEYKLHTIKILDTKTKQEKELLKDLKKFGIYDFTKESIEDTNNNEINNDHRNDYHYGGDDDNDRDLRM